MAVSQLRELIAFDTDRFELPLPPEHRFPMAKYRELRERILASDLPVQIHAPPAATNEQLARVHCSEYIERAIAGTLDPVEVRRIGFPWSSTMVERSRRSTGATIAASRTAIRDGVACNLAGGTHHAGRSRGQGYCVFNDAAVAIAELLDEGMIQAAVVIDTDVHQGNGTAEIFADDHRVRTLSIHGEKNFPARKCPSDIDVALPTGTTDAAYLAALSEAIDALLELTRPDLAVFTSGADPYVDDTLGALALSKLGLRRRDSIVFERCLKARIPVAVTMGGGYAESIDDIVDIHFQTVSAASRFRQAWDR